MTETHEINQPPVEVKVVVELFSKILGACMMENLTPEELDREEWLDGLPSTD